jgi:hypothetical protein
LHGIGSSFIRPATLANASATRGVLIARRRYRYYQPKYFL